ncbi:Cyclic nucleotide-binding-like [Phytophthora cactorum]|nr:Cyclic nucleotide-binding-like [Phytophthora cactorum]
MLESTTKKSWRNAAINPYSLRPPCVQRTRRLVHQEGDHADVLGGSDELELFRHSLVEHLHFEGYPSDESIVVEGSHVQLHSRSLLALKRPIGLRRGDFFGERGLLGSAISAYTVQSVRACDVLSLSSEALVEVMDQYKFSHLGLRICECAYGHLKKKNLVACSKMDLEEHWGAACWRLWTSYGDDTRNALEFSSHTSCSLVVTSP